MRERTLQQATFILSIFTVLLWAGATAFAAPPDKPVAKKITVDLTCVGPGLPNSAPPCENPPAFLPNPDPKFFMSGVEGTLELTVFEDDTAYFEVDVHNVPEGNVLTAWITYCSPRPGGEDDPETKACDSPLISPPLGGRPSIPLQSLFAGVTNGMGRDPNYLHDAGDESWKTEGFLEYNPLKSQQGPIANGVEVNQGNRTDELKQPPCCFGGGGGFARLQPVGGGYMREFEEGGFQKVDENGLPVLVRSPVPAWIIPVISHTDDLTHGVHSGGPGGGAFLVGMFFLCNPDTGLPHCMD